MNKKWKKKWVKALRSGDYEQCTGKLHKAGDGFCCLGVLCDIVGAGRWKKKDRDSIYPKNHQKPIPVKEMFYVGEDSESSEVLPAFIFEEVGLDNSNPYVQTNGDGDTLSELNDGGYNFNSIADFIEESL